MFQHVEIGTPKSQERPMFGVLAGPHSLVLSTDAQEPLDRGGEPHWEPEQLATLVLDNDALKSVSTDPRVIVHYHPESGVSSFIQRPLDHELILQSRHYLKAHPFAIKLRTVLRLLDLQLSLIEYLVHGQIPAHVSTGAGSIWFVACEFYK